jgi:hypothetical protein
VVPEVEDGQWDGDVSAESNDAEGNLRKEGSRRRKGSYPERIMPRYINKKAEMRRERHICGQTGSEVRVLVAESDQSLRGIRYKTHAFGEQHE